MPKNKEVVDVSDVKKEVVFTVKYKNKDCKTYAISVLNVLGFLATNGEPRSPDRLDRDVTVHVSENKDVDTTKQILKIFASDVKKAAPKLFFKVNFKNNHQEKALYDLRALEGVEVDIEKRLSGESPPENNVTVYKHAPLTLSVVGDIDPGTVLGILKKHGDATQVKAGTSS